MAYFTCARVVGRIVVKGSHAVSASCARPALANNAHSFQIFQSGTSPWPICDDILILAQYVPKDSIDVVVCMGDTLPHLKSVAQVRALVEACWQALRPSGRLLLTFRDYSQALQGLDRIIPVRLDADRLMTCILDYAADHVEVTDLIYTRVDAGWDVHKSRYRKLRLAPDEVVALLRSLGFEVTSIAGRMITIVAMNRNPLQGVAMSVCGRFCFSNSGMGVKLSFNILAGPTVPSAVGACPPHDGVR